jgi:hypothetical protein
MSVVVTTELQQGGRACVVQLIGLISTALALTMTGVIASPVLSALLGGVFSLIGDSRMRWLDAPQL